MGGAPTAFVLTHSQFLRFLDVFLVDLFFGSVPSDPAASAVGLINFRGNPVVAD